MPTEELSAEAPGAIERAASILRAGHLVAFPTDTLYGLGADLFNAPALNRLFKAKSRELAKGIPVLLSGPEHLSLVAGQVPDLAWSLVDRYWPGPLTLILPKRSGLPSILSPNDGIAVRVPDHPVARRFIEAAGGAIAATSANLSGEPPATNAQEIEEALGRWLTLILDGGPVQLGVASTILDCRVIPPKIIRSGPIELGELQAIMERGL